MPSDGADPDESEGESTEKTYQEYRRAKARADLHDDHDRPRDPAAEMREEAGIGTGLEELTGEGVEKSMQDELEEVVADVDFLGFEEAGDGEKVRLSLTQADIEDAQRTPEERREALLRGIRGELHALNRQAEFGGSGGGSSVSKGENAVEVLEAIGDELERQEETARVPEEDVQGFEDMLNAYVQAAEENSVNDPAREVLEWMLDQAGEMEGEARRKVFAAVASVQNTEMEQSETLV